ncbi:MAG: cysteine--tRNA ligase [Actinomycetota bacterium]
MTNLKVYNTLAKRKQDFKPGEGGRVSMYVCGPTVYNYISIGNTRPVIVFNMIRNYLEHKGYKVDYVQNITDIEDKIIEKAKQEGVQYQEITKRYINAFLEDLKNLKISGFKDMPRATDTVPQIIRIIERIIENGYGYVVDGNVYFDVGKFPEYGKLSGQKIDQMKSQDSGEGGKINSIDFALWKKAKPGEPSWDSPWGRGRPGWHIECSAMSTTLLAKTIDIHGGGLDLVFPHHENEIAQSEAAYPHNGKFVKYWLHNGMIEVKDEKMSKSSGLKDEWILKNCLRKYSHNTIKMYMLSTHYRSPLEFSDEKLQEAKRAVDRISNTLRNMIFLSAEGEKSKKGMDQEISRILKGVEEEFVLAMDDDFNSARALGAIFEMVKKINMIIQAPDFASSPEASTGLEFAYKKILELAGVLGFDLTDEIEEIKSGGRMDAAQVEKLIAERKKARKDRDYHKADQIRQMLLEEGIMLEDRKEGTIWKNRGESDDL